MLCGACQSACETSEPACLCVLAAACVPKNVAARNWEYERPPSRKSAVCLTGIFVDDILDAVPIDKWFEMFKPAAAGEGGFIRVHMSFSDQNPAVANNAPTFEPATPTGTRKVTCHNVSFIGL